MASVSQDQLIGVTSDQAIKVPCKAAATTNITLSAEQTIDGVALVTDDRVLLTGQTDGIENGIYTVDTGAWSRAPDWDGTGDVVTGTSVYVYSGTNNAGYWEVTTTGTITPGTTSVALGQNIPGGSSDANVVVQRTDTNAESTTVHNYNEKRFYVMGVDYGASLTANGTDDWTTVIQNAITDATSGDTIYFPPGTYKITDQLLFDTCTGIRFIGASRVNTIIRWNTTADATKALVKIVETNYCYFGSMTIEAVNQTSNPGFGIYLTSDGAGASAITAYNSFEDVYVRNVSVSGIQVGNFTTPASDINIDGNVFKKVRVTDCEDYGARIWGANTNNTTFDNLIVERSTNYGVEVANATRNVIFKSPQMANNGTAHFYIGNDFSAEFTMKDCRFELTHALLVSEAMNGASQNAPFLKLENIHCTYQGSGYGILDIDHAGLTMITDCSFQGPADPPSGTDAELKIYPSLSTTLGGMATLITQGVHLYKGAQWNVKTKAVASTGLVNWIDHGHGYSAGPAPNTALTTFPNTILHGRKYYADYMDASSRSGVSQESVGLLSSQVIKVTVDYTSFIAAATTEKFAILTYNNYTRITGVYCDTTTPFAGLAGTIQISVGNSPTPTGFILAHDVKTAVVTKGLADGDLGTFITRANAVQGAYIPSVGGSNQQVFIQLTSGSGNIGTGSATNMSAGSVDVYICVEMLV